MGYKVKPKQYKLKFRDAEFEGLEVIMGSMTVGEWDRMIAPASADPAERATANDENLALFADRIISWNLEDAKGKPVPVTLKAVKEQDRPFMTALVTAWQLAIVGVDPTSPQESPDGEEKTPVSMEDLEAMAAMEQASSPGS